MIDVRPRRDAWPRGVPDIGLMPCRYSELRRERASGTTGAPEAAARPLADVNRAARRDRALEAMP